MRSFPIPMFRATTCLGLGAMFLAACCGSEAPDPIDRTSAAIAGSYVSDGPDSSAWTLTMIGKDSAVVRFRSGKDTIVMEYAVSNVGTHVAALP